MWFPRFAIALAWHSGASWEILGSAPGSAPGGALGNLGALVGKGKTWAIAVRRGSHEKSLFLLNSGRFFP